MDQISLGRIDFRDKRYRISYPLSDDVLVSSIGRIGMIQPVVLTGGPRFRVVTGHKRIEAALSLGLEEVPAVVLKGLDDRRALLLGIHENIKRVLNIVEKSHTLAKMIHFHLPADDISEVAVVLGLQPHEKVLKALVDLANSDEPFKTFVACRALSLKNVAHLLRFDPEERASILTVLRAIHTTEGSVREILEMLSLIRLRDGGIPKDLCATAGGGEELRSMLKQKAHPLLSSLQNALRDLKQRCALPPNMDIKVDPFFEKEYIDIHIRARKPEDVKEATDRLAALLRCGHIGGILDLAKG
jgi:hypothetical protein